MFSIHVLLLTYSRIPAHGLVLKCTFRVSFPFLVKPLWKSKHPKLCLLEDFKSNQVDDEDSRIHKYIGMRTIQFPHYVDKEEINAREGSVHSKSRILIVFLAYLLGAGPGVGYRVMEPHWSNHKGLGVSTQALRLLNHSRSPKKLDLLPPQNFVWRSFSCQSPGYDFFQT